MRSTSKKVRLLCYSHWAAECQRKETAAYSQDPELNLSAAPFITYVHAHHANKGIHAPGVGTYRCADTCVRCEMLDSVHL